MKKIKQVILIRKDLKMRRGKEVAQGSHASMAFLIEQIRSSLTESSADSIPIHLNAHEKEWIATGMAKVCLRVNSESELLDYHRQAQALGLTSHLITDSGRTEFSGVPTLTACAIGPNDAESIDSVTGALSPY
ncbi:MAG: aminoacyl-tRNA hydrolase [Leptolyngbyaceae cyanobacterium MO_188.B28]|nr:aminoacyl-tRNA hydrolase [Leptolyngbyaceae cyanobacterium MO_188.B28]